MANLRHMKGRKYSCWILKFVQAVSGQVKESYSWGSLCLKHNLWEVKPNCFFLPPLLSLVSSGERGEFSSLRSEQPQNNSLLHHSLVLHNPFQVGSHTHKEETNLWKGYFSEILICCWRLLGMSSCTTFLMIKLCVYSEDSMLRHCVGRTNSSGTTWL